MNKKKSFTKAQHKKAGAMLRKIRSQLFTFAQKVDAAYPRSISKRAFKAIESIFILASTLDNCLARESTEQVWDKENLRQVYLGHDKSRSE